MADYRKEGSVRVNTVSSVADRRQDLIWMLPLIFYKP